MKDTIIIWGAGDIGKQAYYYYKNKGYIKCFIDNNTKLQGSRISGVPVKEPDYLKTVNDVKIILAVRRRREEIQKQLLEQYHITRFILFDISEEIIEICRENDPKNAKEIIIEYEGGLGNQMFQYAFSKCFMKRGCEVTADISTYYYPGRRKFVLNKVFGQTDIFPANISLKWNYKKNNLVYCEKSIYEEVNKQAQLQLLNNSEGYFIGYWQSYEYVSRVEQELRKDFTFTLLKEKKLKSMEEQIKSVCAVSVHVRRGDYLLRKSQEIMGEICTSLYYENAIRYVCEHIPDAVFFIFSDDIEWCRERFKNLHAVFSDASIYDHYEDWYDMYLMSCCKHNIIANSTFSWWGAWLNKNTKKIVIAPSRWLNVCDMVDICPNEWIRL